jgi:Rha family phage regulatory protein
MSTQVIPFQQQASNSEQLVQVKDGKIFTTSLIVAEAFEKQHKNVLRDIRELECSDEFAQRNFLSGSYRDARGKSQPMYHLTRDGFFFLATGFTGKRAAVVKETFIVAAKGEKVHIDWKDSSQVAKLLAKAFVKFA